MGKAGPQLRKSEAKGTEYSSQRTQVRLDLISVRFFFLLIFPHKISRRHRNFIKRQAEIEKQMDLMPARIADYKANRAATRAANRKDDIWLTLYNNELK